MKTDAPVRSLDPSLRTGGVAGLLGVVLNVAAVVLLNGVPSPYRPGDLEAWRQGILAHRDGAVASAWCFTVGLVLLVPFAMEVGRLARSGLLRTGVVLLSAGALLDAAGTLATVVVTDFVPRSAEGAIVGRALLAFTLLLDAHFNLMLGIALLLVSVALLRSRTLPRWLAILGLIAGLASLPVGLQASSDAYAKLLGVSGPLWLAWMTIVSVRFVRGRGAEGAARGV
jgi:hypothetical protein